MLRKNVGNIYNKIWIVIIWGYEGDIADSFLCFFMLNMYCFHNKEDKNKCPFVQVSHLKKQIALHLITPHQMLLFYFGYDGLIKKYMLSSKVSIKNQLVVCLWQIVGCFPTVKVGSFSTFSAATIQVFK